MSNAKLYENELATRIAHNPIQYHRSKYIEIDGHFMK